jgi:TM2 domain-containing membrane protein YozV
MMGILGGPANKMSWGIFLFIILFLYVISVFIDLFVMKKKGFFYTYQLKKYNRSIVEDRRNECTSCNGFSEKSK